MSCPTCQVITCVNPSDFALYNLNDGTIFTNPRFSFVMDCPPGYSCHGPYPITITIPPGTINLPVPPDPTVLRLQCCESEISRNVPTGATSDQIAALAAEMISLCAAQQARCDVKTQPPGPGLPPPTKITPTGDPTVTRTDIWNTAQTATAYCGSGNDGTVTNTIPAHSYGTTLFNATPEQIISSQNALNLIAIQQATLGLFGVAPVITSAAVSDAAIGVPYAFTFTASGGTQPYVFAIISGSLPTGLAMDADGNISGTPTSQETTTFTVAISDEAGNQCSRAYSLTVGSGASCPTIVSTPTCTTGNQSRFIYDPVNDRLFCPAFSANQITRFNPNTNLEDGAASASFFPGGVAYIPAQTLNRSTTSAFTSPAVGNNVTIVVSSTALFVAGQNITVGSATYQVVSINDLNHITAKNIDDTPAQVRAIGTAISVVFSGGIIAVGISGSDFNSYLWFIDPAGLTVTQLDQLSSSISTDAIIYASNTKRVFVAFAAGGIDAYDVVNGTKIFIPTPQAGSIQAYKQTTGEVFVWGSFSGNTTINSMDAIAFGVLKSYTFTVSPFLSDKNLAYSPLSDCIYAGFAIETLAGKVNKVGIINATTFLLVSIIDFPEEAGDGQPYPRVSYSSTQSLVYVQYGGTGGVTKTAIINPLTNTVICTLDVGIGNATDTTSTNRFYGGDYGVSNTIIETKP